jgi:hypothetical protein
MYLVSFSRCEKIYFEIRKLMITEIIIAIAIKTA